MHINESATGFLIKLTFIAIFVLLAHTSSAEPKESYEPIHRSLSHPAPGLVKTVTRFQTVTRDEQGHVTRHPLNQFNLVRVKKIRGPITGPLLLRSPFNYDSRYYEIPAKASDYSSTLLARLAYAGIDVWVLDDRINPLNAGACETGEVDCSIMGQWNLATKTRDIDYIRRLIAREHPHTKPVLGGLVGGGMDTLAALNENPDHYSAFFSWQGTLYSADPHTQNLNNSFCDLAEQTLAAGVSFDPGAAAFKQLFAAARDYPDLPAPEFPVSEMPSGLTMREALFFILSQAIVNPSFPTPKWRSAIGEYQPSTLRFVDEQQLFALEPIANNYTAIATMADYSCALAGRRNFTDNLADFSGEVMLIGSEYAFGPALVDTASLFTGARKIHLNVMSGRGELDDYLVKNRNTLVVDALTVWIQGQHKRAARQYQKNNSVLQ